MSPTSFQTAPPRVSNIIAAFAAYTKINIRFLIGRRWIRTTEGVASRFTVCPLWPLGNPPMFNYSLCNYSLHKKCRCSDSNRKPADYKSAALPIEPHRQKIGTYRARTCDPLLVRQMLSQLS